MRKGHRGAAPGRGPGVLPILILAAAAGCSVTLPPRARPEPTAAHVLDVPVAEFGEERCGAGSLSALLAWHGIPRDIEALDAEIPKAPDGGVLSIDLLLVARRHGIPARWVEGSEASLRATLHGGTPVILMMRVLNLPGRRGDVFHYVVVDGVDPASDRFRFQFGDGQARWSPLSRRLRRAWRAAGFAMLLTDRRS